MATLEVDTDGYTGGFYWRITGFQSPFDTDTYIRAGITSKSFTDGGTSISGLLDISTAASPTGKYQTSWQWVDYDPGDYTFYGFAQGQDGRYWSAGDADATVYGDTTVTVEPWDWTVSNGDATKAQTKRAYSAITGNGSCSDFSYKVWNDMCAKTMEYIDAIGSVWATAYAKYSDTLMTSTDKVLTAKRFNALKNNIGSRQSTGIPTVSAGDPVLGEYFETMMDVLNELIADL